MENPIKMDDLGGPTPIFGTPRSIAPADSSKSLGDGCSGSQDATSWCLEEEILLSAHLASKKDIREKTIPNNLLYGCFQK